MRLGYVGHVEEVNISDLDSHADCCVCAKEVLFFNDFDREVAVAGCDPEGETQFMSIVSASMGYTIRESGQTMYFHPTFESQSTQHHTHEIACVKLRPLRQPHLRARIYAETNPSAQRATQLRSVFVHMCYVSRQNLNTKTVP
jgi:hypothetical protein